MFAIWYINARCLHMTHIEILYINYISLAIDSLWGVLVMCLAYCLRMFWHRSNYSQKVQLSPDKAESMKFHRDFTHEHPYGLTQHWQTVTIQQKRGVVFHQQSSACGSERQSEAKWWYSKFLIISCLLIAYWLPLMHICSAVTAMGPGP